MTRPPNNRVRETVFLHDLPVPGNGIVPGLVGIGVDRPDLLGGLGVGVRPGPLKGIEESLRPRRSEAEREGGRAGGRAGVSEWAGC